MESINNFASRYYPEFDPSLSAVILIDRPSDLNVKIFHIGIMVQSKSPPG